MAEKRKSSSAESGAKRIKALFSSFIRKENKQDKSSSAANILEECPPVEETDGGSTSKLEDTPSKRTFRPMDSDDFFQRVETYTAFGWFAKPAEVSPLHCARYGWVNKNPDCLQCVSCSNIVCGSLPAVWETESYSQACKKLKDSLREGHTKLCPWSDSPSPESFLYIPLSDIRLMVDDFFLRVDSMQALGGSIPKVDWSPLKEEDWLNTDHVKSVLLKAITERKDSADISADQDQPEWLAICLLALFGWQTSASEQTECPILLCKYCRRHAGLWNFIIAKEDDPKPAEVTECQEETNRINDIEKSLFNPSTEHRLWCPWIRISSTEPIKLQRPSAEPITSSGDSKPTTSLAFSWQQLLVILLKRTDPHSYGPMPSVINTQTTPPSQAWKAVRRILDVWQSKTTAPLPNQATHKETTS